MASAWQKTVNKLRKKLREIEQIESRIAAGEQVDHLQLKKVDNKPQIDEELEEMTAGVEAARSLPTEPPQQGTQQDSESLASPSKWIDEEIEDARATASKEPDRTASRAGHRLVACAETKKCPRMERGAIARFVAEPKFGERLCGRGGGITASVYNQVARLAARKSQLKDRALESKLWSLSWQTKEWLGLPINLRRRCDRETFLCTADIYNYMGAPSDTLIVDFANRHIGGGCFGGGFVQEEQMVMQSTDFAIRLHAHRQTLSWHQGISYEGVYMDAWWPRAAAAKKARLDLTDIQPHMSNPLTILAVDAPKMRSSYRQDDLQMLAAKVLLVFAAAERLCSPQIFSGLLGGGAFRNNRPLILLLHLLLQPSSDTRPVMFHHPVFWSFSVLSMQTLEANIVERADRMMEALRDQGVTTLGDALAVLLSWRLPLSEQDMDLT